MDRQAAGLEYDPCPTGGILRRSYAGPSNDNPNYIIQVGNVFGFIISIENIF